MGAIPNDIHQAIEILKTDPDRAHWSHRRCISLTKTSTGKLGIKVDIIEGKKETFSVVTKVKPECCLGRGDVLHLLDRILFINQQDIRSLAPTQLWKFLSSLSTSVIEVLVCSLVSISSKRSRDQVSNSSCRSCTGMRKGPDNKRRPVESEPLLQGLEGQQSPEIRPFLDSTGLRSSSCDENWTTSLPIVDSRTQAITDINGRTCSSLPATMSNPLLVRPSTNTNDLLRFPHFIHWDPITKTVSLTRGARGSFGFKFKVKMSKNADDLYTLVECITPDGPADGKLMVGDWIRSVNGQPLQSPREASSIPELLAKETTVRIVLQRPEGLSQNIFPPTPSLPDPDVHYPSVPGLPLASESPKMPAYQRLPTHNSGKGRPVSCDAVQRGGKSYRVTPLPESSDPQDPQDINVDLFELNRTVNLPKVRVFLCGSEARALARLLLPGMLSAQPDNSNGLYQCVKCTMGMDREGAISFTSWSSFDYLLNDESSSRLHASNESLTKSDIFRDREETSSFIHKGSINVEFFIMPDDRFTSEDKFFHHCCQYLFTRTSIFVLTFDGAKVVTSTHTEIQRLQNVIHTIRCFDGYECPILTYGLLYNDATVGVDEVRTLFYLPFGQQIQKYNVPMPELFCPGVDSTEANDVSRRLQRGLWKVLGEMTLKQKISLPSVAMMLQFETVRSGEQKLFIDEVEFSGMFQDVVPGGGQDLQQIVWTDLKNVGEILSSKAAPLTLPHVLHLDKFLFIDPKVLLDCVQNVNVFLQQLKGVQSLEGTRQKGVRGLSTGVITEEDLIDIVSQQCHNSVERIIHLLEIFGLIFRQKSGTDSGGMNYLVPYVITDQSTLAPPTTEPTELCLYVDFRMHTSSLVFYQLAFAINNSSDSQSLTMIGPASCCLSHLGYDLTLHHHKLRDRIQINLARSEAAAKPYVLYQWLHKVCKATLGSEVKYVLGPSCPLQEKCFFISHHHSDMHVLDLSKRQICCSEKLDNHRKIKLWLPNMMGKYVNELPHTILRMISQKLHLGTAFGNDWKLLGGLLGLSGEKIALYDTHKEPAYQLLMDQGRSHRLTLALLLELLQHPDMERRDITSGIEDWLDNSPQTP